MNNQEILDNAPEGATHVLFQSINYIYIKFGVHTESFMYCNHKEGWRLATHVFHSNLRSLADIKRIVELEKERNILLYYYFDANRWFSKHDPNHYISPDAEKSKNLLKAHNLEQQAKVVENLKFPSMLRKMWSGGEVQEWLDNEARALKEQS
jgi:hypothetical protein